MSVRGAYCPHALGRRRRGDVEGACCQLCQDGVPRSSHIATIVYTTQTMTALGRTNNRRFLIGVLVLGRWFWWGFTRSSGTPTTSRPSMPPLPTP
jgi:hypothetical protein